MAPGLTTAERDELARLRRENKQLRLELQLEELEAGAAEDGAALDADAADDRTDGGRIRRKPVRGPLPTHLPRERVVIPGPTACPCCLGTLSKLGEDVTEMLELVPRRFKVIQTVREKFVCRACETITQPPVPFHPIERSRAGPELLATSLEAKFGQHLPLHRQSETFAREGIELDTSTLADWVGACTTTLSPLVALIRAHVQIAERLHGDDTTVPVLARGKASTGRLWAYVRDDRPFAGPAPLAMVFHCSPDRRGEHPQRHLASYAGNLQAEAYAPSTALPSAAPQSDRLRRWFGELYHPGRKPGPITEAGCWAHGRNLRRRARHQRLARRTAPPRAAEPSGAAGVGTGDLDAGGRG